MEHLAEFDLFLLPTSLTDVEEGFNPCIRVNGSLSPGK
jgi:hypothetical protein